LSSCIMVNSVVFTFFFFFQAEDGIRDLTVTGVQTCALPIYRLAQPFLEAGRRLPTGISGCGSSFTAEVARLHHGDLRRIEVTARSEERRVGKECRSRRGGEDYEKKKIRSESLQCKASSRVGS